MQVSEENKQEAEKVREKYIQAQKMKLIYYGQNFPQSFEMVDMSYHCAIQDRQSVLDNNLKMISQLMKSKKAVIALSTENRNLTEQIEYLKSKL